jgi:hypothetical protein
MKRSDSDAQHSEDGVLEPDEAADEAAELTLTATGR